MLGNPLADEVWRGMTALVTDHGTAGGERLSTGRVYRSAVSGSCSDWPAGRRLSQRSRTP